MGPQNPRIFARLIRTLSRPELTMIVHPLEDYERLYWNDHKCFLSSIKSSSRMSFASTLAPKVGEGALLSEDDAYVTQKDFGKFTRLFEYSIQAVSTKMEESMTEMKASISLSTTEMKESIKQMNESLGGEMRRGFNDVNRRLEALETHPKLNDVHNSQSQDSLKLASIRAELGQVFSEIASAPELDDSRMRRADELFNEEKQLLIAMGCVVWWGSTRKRATPCFIDNMEMEFVNRSIPIRQILEVFEHTYYQKPITRIAVINAAKGNGKTSLGKRFLDVCDTVDTFKSYSADFKDTLANAQQITIDLSEVKILGAMSSSYSECSEALRDCFKSCLDKLMANHVLEGNSLSFGFSKTLLEAVSRFIAHTKKPLLLFIDNLGGGTQSTSGYRVEIRTQLMQEFIQYILRPLVKVPNLFILVATGEDDFLEWVDSRTSGLWELVPIDLNLIRENYIDRILEKTMICDSEKGIVSLKSFYGIETAEQLKAARDAIIGQTNGHPQSMAEMLKNCKSMDSLLNYAAVLRTRGVDDLENWLGVMSKYQDGITKLMEAVESQRTINMREFAVDGVHRLSLSQVAEKIHIRWEGENMESARVFAPEPLKQLFRHLSLDFKIMVAKLRIDKLIFYDYSMYWEQFLLRRIQEAFGRGDCPGELMPSFFGQSLKFGVLRSMKVPGTYRRIPKISDKGQTTFHDMHQPTLHPSLWKCLLEEMSARLFDCFIPYPTSSSSDSIILANGVNEKGEKIPVWVGIAAKCIQTKLSKTMIGDEIGKFNRMFTGTERNPGELRILLIISSGGFASQAMETNWERCLNIDETILIDLSDREKRTSFFGLSEDKDSIDKIEYIVAKRVGALP